MYYCYIIYLDYVLSIYLSKCECMYFIIFIRLRITIIDYYMGLSLRWVGCIVVVVVVVVAVFVFVVVFVLAVVVVHCKMVVAVCCCSVVIIIIYYICYYVCAINVLQKIIYNINTWLELGLTADSCTILLYNNNNNKCYYYQCYWYNIIPVLHLQYWFLPSCICIVSFCPCCCIVHCSIATSIYNII